VTPAQLLSAGHKLYGRRYWVTQLAKSLGVDRGTIYRLMKREQILGPYEVAVNGLLENWRRRMEIERAARKLRPKLRRRNPPTPRLRRDKDKAAGT
jgi:IS30 family transposase